MDDLRSYTAKELRLEREAHEAALVLLAGTTDLEDARKRVQRQLDDVIAEQDARTEGNREQNPAY